MKKMIISCLVGVFSVSAMAHEWTPTYPKLKLSHIQNVWVTEMKLFNGRSDIDYYQIRVYDEDWNVVPHAVINNPVEVSYQTHKMVDVYIKSDDKDRAVYICSKSKPLQNDEVKPMIFSRICSKIK